jgi:hypothetical protein
MTNIPNFFEFIKSKRPQYPTYTGMLASIGQFPLEGATHSPKMNGKWLYFGEDGEDKLPELQDTTEENMDQAMERWVEYGEELGYDLDVQRIEWKDGQIVSTEYYGSYNDFIKQNPKQISRYQNGLPKDEEQYIDGTIYSRSTYVRKEGEDPFNQKDFFGIQGKKLMTIITKFTKDHHNQFGQSGRIWALYDPEGNIIKKIEGTTGDSIIIRTKMIPYAQKYWSEKDVKRIASISY